MSGRLRLAGAFLGGVVAMAIVFGVVALSSGGGDSNSAQNVNATPAPAAAAANNNHGAAANVTTSGECMSAADIYQQVRPSVVEVDIVGGNGFQEIAGTGTGIVLDNNGYILTNDHVVDQANEITVRFEDGATVSANVVGTDNQNDLAVIKVDPSAHDLAPATLGDSSDLRVGDTVLALGNPFNLEGTLTQGIVSGLDRAYSEGNSTRPIRGLIQTDAAINPGNSGGPLIDCHADVVGINTLLENPTGDSVNVGVGFAVSINTAKSELSDLKTKGETVSHAWLGIAGVDVTPTVKDELGLTVDKGVYVTLVTNGSPADEAGLVGAFANQSQAQNNKLVKGGDVIVTADGKDVTGIDQLASYLDLNKRPGDKVELGIIRDGKSQTVTATLADWPNA